MVYFCCCCCFDSLGFLDFVVFWEEGGGEGVGWERVEGEGEGGKCGGRDRKVEGGIEGWKEG